MPGRAAWAVGVLFVAGISYWAGSQAGTPPVAARAEQWRCPMHPEFTSTKPGVAPCCGMQLEIVSAENSVGLKPGMVKIRPEQAGALGIRLAAAQRSQVQLGLRASGRVTVDENRLYPLVLKVEGSVRRIHPEATTGSFVKKGQPLVDIYSFDFLTAQQTYFVALEAAQRAGEMAGLQSPEQVEAKLIDSRYSLLGLGFLPEQIEEIGKTQQVYSTLTMRAPASGYILSRNVYRDTRVERGTEMFRLADLERVWILTDIFPRDGEHVTPGQKAVIKTSREGVEVEARVGEILPQYDAGARTLQVRLEAENRQALLRPEMVVEVRLTGPGREALTVPASAVMHSGLHHVVYVAAEGGVYEPRMVEVGQRTPGEVEIVKGLAEGERVVVAGNFLIDSESRMQLAAGGGAEAVKDPVCGMMVRPSDPKAWTLREAEGVRYFCSEACRKTYAGRGEKARADD